MGLFCHGLRLNISKNGMLCLINTAIDEAMHQNFDFEEQMRKIFQIITEITVCRAVCRVFDCACGAEIALQSIYLFRDQILYGKYQSGRSNIYPQGLD